MMKHTTVFAPTGALIDNNALANTPTGAALFRALAGHYVSPAQPIEELVDNAIANIVANNSHYREVVLQLVNCGEYVDISVLDGGTGIRNLSNALTISGRAAAESPFNEHGYGLKNALAALCGTEEEWCIETRTQEDAKANCYQYISSPYAAINETMQVQRYSGSGSVVNETGTVIRVRCPYAKFKALKPNNKRSTATFRELVGYLIEELSYTYASILAENKIFLGVVTESDGEQDYHIVEALEPVWMDDTLVELPETEVDLGRGKLTVRCRYGMIHANKENVSYYKGNMASSGLEIRINGRCVERGLYSKVFGKALHPSCNRFLAQIDLIGTDGAAFPPTETTKNAFVESDARTQALFAWLRSNICQPGHSKESLEKQLVGKLAEKKLAEGDTLRVSREEGTYRSICLRSKIDLFVSKADGVTIYEAKAKNTKGEDLYQLRLYADGCAMDGIPVGESVLIGEHHPKEVRGLAKQLNTQCDPTGKPYRFVLRTWAEEGISA